MHGLHSTVRQPAAAAASWRLTEARPLPFSQSLTCHLHHHRLIQHRQDADHVAVRQRARGVHPVCRRAGQAQAPRRLQPRRQVQPQAMPASCSLLPQLPQPATSTPAQEAAVQAHERRPERKVPPLQSDASAAQASRQMSQIKLPRFDSPVRTLQENPRGLNTMQAAAEAASRSSRLQDGSRSSFVPVACAARLCSMVGAGGRSGSVHAACAAGGPPTWRSGRPGRWRCGR